MKTYKTILIASSSMLAAGMARGAVVYNFVNVSIDRNSSGIQIDLNGDGTNDFRVFFDANNATKPCVLGANTINGTYPGTFPNPIPLVFNELNMNPVPPASNNNNGVPVIPLGTTISSLVTVGTNTLTVGDLGGDTHGKNEGYLVQNGENTVVGQWPAGQDTMGYVGLALVDTNTTPATTNYGWVRLELDYTQPTERLTVVDYAYESIPNSNSITGDNGLTVPKITSQPTNQTSVAGATVTLNVLAAGNPTPAYQWLAGAVGSGTYTNVPNAGNFFGANTATLTISNVTPANQLDYIVTVTNVSGSVTSSPPATLTVLPAGLIGPVPSQQVIYAGYPAQFTVTDLGGGFTNAWQRNGAGLSNGGAYSGTTSSNLVISSVDPTNVGNYTAIVGTAYGAVTSSIAPLSIANPDGSLYESVVRAYGAVNYYRLNETTGTNAWDFIGGKTGFYNSPTASLGNPGLTPASGFPGFVDTNYAGAFQADGNIDTNAYVAALPWNLNANTVTITAWIYPTAVEGAPGQNSGIVFTAGTGNMVCGIRYDGTYSNTNGINDANIGYSWNNDGGAGQWNSQITAPHNKWSLVALAVSPTNATLYIINADGVQSAVDTRNHDPALFNATEYIGTYPLEAPLGRNNFFGYIDEVAIFKSTLSSNQVAVLYGSALNVQPPPSPIAISTVGNNIRLQWVGGALLHATNLLGPWITNTAATSPYTVSPTNSREFFRTQSQ